MANMSYCQFENTRADLRQCLASLAEAADDQLTLAEFISQRSSDYEAQSVMQMYHACKKFVELCDDMSETII